MYRENEITKHKKRKESSISKANKKSNHKHDYKFYKKRVADGEGDRYHKRTNDKFTKISRSDWKLEERCSICGKIREHFFYFNNNYEELLEQAIEEK